jgi:hypothetical protein
MKLCHSNRKDNCTCTAQCINCDLKYNPNQDPLEKSIACMKRQEVIYGFKPIPPMTEKQKANTCERCFRLMMANKCTHKEQSNETLS